VSEGSLTFGRNYLERETLKCSEAVRKAVRGRKEKVLSIMSKIQSRKMKGPKSGGETTMGEITR